LENGGDRLRPVLESVDGSSVLAQTATKQSNDP
jgi:hypothetical protein